MNEEVNYCDQCGAKTSPEAKFCSNCGSALDVVASTEFDVNDSVPAPNETAAKEMGASSDRLSSVSASWKKARQVILIFLAGGALLYSLVFIGYALKESSLKSDFDNRIQAVNSMLKAPRPEADDNAVWEVVSEVDPTSGKILVRSAIVKNHLCNVKVHRPLDEGQFTSIGCRFRTSGHMRVKFDNDDTVYHMNYFFNKFEGRRKLSMADTLRGDEEAANSISYDHFIRMLKTAKTVAIKMTPSVNGYWYRNEATQRSTRQRLVNLPPVWVRFPLTGAKEAIEQLGKQPLDMGSK
jgi:hypothetical protein